MQPYVVQKAIDAFEELSNDGALKERIAGAWAHLGGHDDDYWLEDAEDVKEAYKVASEARIAGNLGEEAAALRSVITRIFIENGYAKAVSELNSK